MKLYLKLGIFVLVLFALVIATCLLWKPIMIRWYERKLESGTPVERLETIGKLLAMGDEGKTVVDNYLVGQSADWLTEQLGKPKFTSAVGMLRLGEPVPSYSHFVVNGIAPSDSEVIKMHYEKIRIDFINEMVEKAVLEDLAIEMPLPKKPPPKVIRGSKKILPE